MAGGQGFEPRLAESESAVLPLDDPPIPRLADRMGGQDRPAHTRLLTLRVLRTFSRFVQTDLLALDLAGVAGEEAGTAQGAAERLVMLHQRTGAAVPDGAGLAAVAAAAHGDREIHGVRRIGQLHWLAHDAARRLTTEVIFDGAAVDGDLARARAQEHTRRRGL